MTNLDWIRTLTAAELSNWFYNEWLEHMQYAWSSSRGGLEYWLSEERVADTPQTDCETCKHNGEYAYCRLCGRLGEDNYEPQTDCAWK